MKKSILPLVFLFGILSACQDNPKPASQDDATVQGTVIPHEEEHAQQSTLVSLNNGEKWSANAETTTGINNMSVLIAEFTPTPKPDDYRSLKAKLETEFNQVIQKCTMTGEAHEQLHRYLIPMTEMFKQLDSENMEVCQKATVELKQHLAEYQNYFL